MTTHRLTANQTIDRPIDEVYDFFARPENLGRLTPRSLGFEQLSTDLAMRPGLEIDYRIRPLLGIPMRWRTRIEDVEPNVSFRDIQLRGPYRRWTTSIDSRPSRAAPASMTRSSTSCRSARSGPSPIGW